MQKTDSLTVSRKVTQERFANAKVMVDRSPQV